MATTVHKHKQWLNVYRNDNSKSFLCPAELSSTLMEKMQAQEIMSGLRIPEIAELGQFFSTLPTSTLVGIGALTAVLAYWLATRPRPIKAPCNLQHQSEEVPVRWSTNVFIDACISKYRVICRNADDMHESFTLICMQVDHSHLTSCSLTIRFLLSNKHPGIIEVQHN